MNRDVQSSISLVNLEVNFNFNLGLRTRPKLASSFDIPQFQHDFT